MINKERLSKYFTDLVSIDSISRREGKIAHYVRNRLQSLGVEVVVDDADKRLHGETGNLIARVKGNTEGIPPILFNGHLDTVQPGENVKVDLSEDIFRSRGDTILGADDKSALAILLEILTILQEESIAHGDLEILFTVCEEIGLLGAKNLDYSLLKAHYGYALDASSTTSIVTKAPAANRLMFKVHGLEAHAGVSPEEGINSIKVACDAISKIKVGRIDDETTANIGIMKGGTATNIIPNLVEVEGEIRSHNQRKLQDYTNYMESTFKTVAKGYQREAPKGVLPYVETLVEKDYPLMAVHDDHPVVQLASRAAQNLGKTMATKSSGGGSDANIFNSKGITTVILGTGMQDVHTTREHIRLRDMMEAAELALEIIKEHSLIKHSL